MRLDGPSCFPSLAKVKLHSGRYVRMSELEVGDQVQAGICIYTVRFCNQNCTQYTTYATMKYNNNGREN